MSVRPSVSVSVTSWSTVKTVRDRQTYDYYGETIGSQYRATQGTHLQPPTNTP